MPRRRSPQADADAYSRGVMHYRRCGYAQALASLEQVPSGALLGELAGYYRGMCHRALGVQALQDGQLERAEAHFRQAGAALGHSADLAGYLSSIYARRGAHARCASQADRAVQLDPSDAKAWRRLAQAQWSAGRRAEAYMTLGEATRKLGDRPPLLLQAGLFAAAEGRLKEAQDRLSRAARYAPGWADAHRYLGLTAAAQGEPAMAAQCFQRALDLRPGDMILAHQLAAAAAAARRQGREVRVRFPSVDRRPDTSELGRLAEAITREPDFLDACLALPSWAGDAELFGMLAEVVRVALADRPAYADLHHRRARILERLGRLDEAREHAERAIRINPSYAQALVHLAKVLTRLDRTDEAVDTLDRAVAAGADWPDVHCLAGQLHAERGRRYRARVHFERALALNEDYERAAAGLRALAA